MSHRSSVGLALALFAAGASMLSQASEPERRYLVQVDGQFGFIDRSGVVAIAPRFASAREFADGLAPVLVGDRWGYVDGAGALVIPPMFEVAEAFMEGLAPVRREQRPVFIDRSGRTVIANESIKGIGRISEGLVPVKIDGKWGFLDKTGATAVPPSFRRVDSFSDGLAAFQDGAQWGFVDRTGVRVLPARFTAVGRFVDGLAPAAVGSEWGVINRRGEFVVAPTHRLIASYSDGLARFTVLDGEGVPMHGFLDTHGTTRIAPSREIIGDMYDGRALIRRGTRYGYVDVTGTEVIPPRFTWAREFDRGLAEVEGEAEGRRWRGYVDTSGRIVWRGPAGVSVR